MKEIADKHSNHDNITCYVYSILFVTGASVAQVAIAWLLHRPAVSSVVIGARTVSQLQDNLKAAQLKLTSEEVSMSWVVCMW